jgi:hypothetical protein
MNEESRLGGLTLDEQEKNDLHRAHIMIKSFGPVCSHGCHLLA